MIWQKNMLQTKKQGKNWQDQLNEEAISNLLEKIQRNDNKDDLRAQK